MWYHYFKTGLRILSRQKVYSLINILGLSTGIAGFLLILLFLQNELSFDRKIPEYSDIYRLVEIQSPAGIDLQHVAITAGPLAPALKADLPEVEATLRIMPAQGNVFRTGDEIFRERYAYYADPSVFRMFNLRLLDQSLPDPLKAPNSAVISEKVADRFFNTRQVVGKTFRFGETPYQVTGLMKNQDHNSHLEFEVLLSYSTAENLFSEMIKTWGNNSMATYVLLSPGTKKIHAEENIEKMLDIRMNEIGMQDLPRMEMYLQPLKDIYLRSQDIKFSISDHRGDINLVYAFSLVALLILLIACINFVNLSTARSAKRALEVGIRKVLGAKPIKLIAQFLGESLILTFLSLMMAVGLVEIMLPEFNSIFGTSLRVDFLGNWIFNIGLLLLLLLVGFIAGIYPALFLSRYQPAKVLKDQKETGKISARTLRKALVIFQFSISTLLVFATLIVFNQYRFMQSMDLGINYDDVVSLRVFQQRTNKPVFQAIKTDLQVHPAISGVAVSSGISGVSGSQGPVVAMAEERELMVRFGFVDEDFFPAMEVPFTHGRNFNREYGTDEKEAAIINEAALKALNLTNPIGQRILVGHLGNQEFSVVGVIRDYNYYSLQSPIEPAFYVQLPERYNTIVVKTKPGERLTAIKHVEEIWKQHFHDLPFEPVFSSETIEEQYKGESNTMRVITFFAGLCIIISALGLYGLAAFMAEQKRKEIGVRKVLGGSVWGMVSYLQKDFLKLVLIAILLSSPFAWLLMSRYLQNYAYTINFTWWQFGISYLIVITIAFVTILFHAYKAAVANPADSLKAE